MKNKISIFSLLCTVIMLSSLSTSSFAATVIASGKPNTSNQRGCGADCSWSLDSDGVLTISGTGNMDDYSAMGAPWDWYSRNGVITTVQFTNDSNITSIGNNAFYNATALSSIDIPSTVTSIGNGAFQSASNLATVTIPADTQLTSIGAQAFYANTNLTSITIPEGVTSIGDWTFNRCTSLTSVEIPSTVTSIGDFAFQYASNLESVIIPENSQLTSLGERVFENDSKLASITLPDTLTSISLRAFGGPNQIDTLVIPDSVTSIEVFAFYEMTGTIYCPMHGSSSPCDSNALYVFNGTTQMYTKDTDGVYSITKDGQTYYYSSADKMVAGGVEDGCTSQASCAAVVATASAQAQQSAGGNGSNQGSHLGKRIYTVEEARQAVEAAGTETVNFRIRYR